MHLSNDFSDLYEWFLNNKLNIYFGVDKIKSILFGTNHKLRKANKLNVTCQEKYNKQNSQVKNYLDCILNETMPGETY